ncbi:dihydrodipicolinate synthase family protein [Arthrobacter crystallopoietes]|uniref:4-hydroxy-tetrahydrodipicolinate synthase n=1 Tax=Crystallibacter crystallopoietes TaxID=37928 RepID=A0A1H0XJJ5_9MICC|nr:4-hydroxy-tetrahydrodipicolinate synthase [Arthrobacter crystallopoietes]
MFMLLLSLWPARSRMKEGLMFDGLCAFPLTPIVDDRIDLKAVALLVSRAAGAGVNSLGMLGSTGNYAYLSRDERRAVLEAAVDAAEGVPVIAGVGAVRTRDVLAHVEDAQATGASALLLAPVSYQRLTEAEVFSLYQDVTAASSVPIVVCDNPRTTGFTFSDELYARLADIPAIASIKIPPPRPGQASARLRELRALLPERTSVGISGDWAAAESLLAGCAVWYSVIAGVLPGTAKVIADHALAGRGDLAWEASTNLRPVWSLFRRYGSLRVTAAIAEHLGLLSSPSLPLPLHGLDSEGRLKVADAIRRCGLEA